MLNWLRSIVRSRRGQRFRSAGDYFRRGLTVGYIGWYGFGNFGDELLFESFRTLMPHARLLLYGGPECRSYNRYSWPPPIEIELHQRFLRDRRFDGVLLGGGTLINDPWYLPPLRSAVAEGVPIAVLGTGVREEEYVRMRHPAWDWNECRSEWAELLARVDPICVRGPHSALQLESLGVESVSIVGDPAIAICRPFRRRHFGGRVGISVGGEDSLVFGSQEIISESVVELIDWMQQKGWEVSLLAMNHSDYIAQKEMVEKAGLSGVVIVEDHPKVFRLLDHISSVDLVVSQRLHPLVVACASGIPSISISHCMKNDDFMESFGIQQLSVRADVVSLRHLTSTVELVLDSYGTLSERLCDTSLSYRHRLCATASRVVADFSAQSG